MLQQLKKLSITDAINLMAILLMWVSVLSGYAKVMASNEAEQSYQKAQLLINTLAQTQKVSIQSAPQAATGQSTSSVTTKRFQVFQLLDRSGNPIRPSALLQVDKSIYLLGGECLYLLQDIAGNSQEEKPLTVDTYLVPGNRVKNIPIQEFLSFCYWPQHKSIVVLDKSGSLFEFSPASKAWQLVRANKRTLGSPDPHYVSIASDGPHLLLLDPERNQIWRYPATGRMEKYFKDVLPWRIHAGDPNVADGIAIAFDGSTYVLRRSGKISIYPSNSCGGNGNPRSLNWKVPPGIIPSRMSVAPHSPVYIVERENSRVVAIDKEKGSVRQFTFPAGSDLRGILPGFGGYGIIDGDCLAFRMLIDHDPAGKINSRDFDPRLKILQIPIKGAVLPRHPGVFPGARRLYRHGVHQGLDFFNDAGAHIKVDTPACAAAAGRIIRADVNYRDMTAAEYSRVMNDCNAKQYCSEANEDLFRGCQVWIDHGNGLVTRYAHLNKARQDLKVGMHVNAGDIIGYIGYSGTGENQPGLVKHPHLHFEIHLDGHYLGYGLTPSETMALYQKVFSAKRGN
jgi:murein DD-endopeptidase MepM/ murein hydrolase activator NlpD